MDHFLDDQNCVDRLVSEYRKHGSLVVGYDFDNTVYDFHKQGHIYTHVPALIRELKELGCYLIVFTASDEIDFIKHYLYENNIPYNSINENPPFFKSNSRKIYFNSFLDDRAGLSAAYNQLKKFISIIKNN